MTTPFKDVSEYLAPDLPLTVRGKVYTVPPPSAEVGMRLQVYWTLTLAARAGKKPSAEDQRILDGQPEDGWYRDALGSAYDELVADRVSYKIIRHAAVTATFDVIHGRDAALEHWLSPIPEHEGKAPAAGTTSTSTAAASTTRTRGSGSGTKSRQAASTS